MKKVMLLLVLALLVLGLAGCGTMQRLLKDGSQDTLGGLLGTGAAPAPDAPSSGESMKITVYFADAAGKTLVPEARAVPKTLSLARETMNELIKGPASNSGLQAVIPSGTVLLDINIKDGTAIVDFSKELQKTVAKISPELTVYSVVNTLTQFPTVKQVKFRVEGLPVQKIGGVNVTQALSSNAQVVKTHPITQKPVSGDISGSSASASGGI